LIIVSAEQVQDLLLAKHTRHTAVSKN